MSELEEYKARDFNYLGRWQIGGTALKVYTIRLQSDAGSMDDILTAAEVYVSEQLPEVVQEEGGGHKVGYLILHVGEVATWLLIHWWAHQDICLSMLAAADLGTSEFTSMDHKRFHACVWEQKIITHESEAWIRTLLSANSDTAKYLEDTLSNGRY